MPSPSSAIGRSTAVCHPLQSAGSIGPQPPRGGRMRLLITALTLSLSLIGCGASTPRGEQVQLPTEKAAKGFGNGSVLMHEVIDVVADPQTGTPVIANGNGPMRWPEGFTAWRVGSEVEVLDPAGNRVLITGGRYLFRSSTWMSYWVISDVEPCPICPLGFQVE